LPAKSTDPLFPLTVRLPATVIEDLRASAARRDLSVSDVFRQSIQLVDVKETGRETPGKSRRPKPVPLPIDPQLLLVLRGIGNNLNQIAHNMNTDNLVGTVPNYQSMLIALVAIERHVGAIREHHVEQARSKNSS
jgi:hypothetical protein